MEERHGNTPPVATVNVLVLWESKHGSTADIGHAIGTALREHDLHVVFAQADQPLPDHHIDAYVIGSAVYAGHWMKHVTRFVHDFADVLRRHPVWLFSSGPLGNPPMPASAPVAVTELVELVGARGHEIFSGKLDRAKLSFPERAITAALHAPEGDFRDWTAVNAWAAGIARQLSRQEARA